MGHWFLFFDEINFAAAWARVKTLYTNKELDGIIKVTCDRKEIRPGRGRMLMFFAGPHSDSEHCLQVGRNLLCKLKHTKQECNFGFPQKIYFKANKTKNEKMKTKPLYELSY